VLAAVGAGEALEAADGAVGLAAESETPALLETEGLTSLESEAQGSLGEIESGLPTEPGAALNEANPTAELPQEPLSDYTANSECQSPGECFTREMLIEGEGGKRPAYTIKEHDLLWSRNEFDPTGPLELKEVQEVFTRVALVCNVHVAGQVIRTTVEHPFFVVGKGWTPAKALRIGDELMTPSGLLMPVEGVANSGVVETVYNWRIADHHTYFVSADEWGVSVWAHNATYEPNPKHGQQSRGTPKGVSSPEPTNGQVALDNSVQIKPTSPRRVGVDAANGEIVVLDQHLPDTFHGHVRSWDDLTAQMQNALRDAELVGRKGNIL
jgi:hypothetical protein